MEAVEVSSRYDQLVVELANAPQRWLVTGAAGFIGSHLVQHLLSMGQHVVGLDNFATGRRSNLEDVLRRVGDAAWARFSFIEGDIRDEQVCAGAVDGCDRVLHQAALGSVPRSIDEPGPTHTINVDGFFCILTAAQRAGVAGFAYASSSSVYGDSAALPKQEDITGQPLSPYAASKAINESYAAAFSKAYGMHTVGLRYFNVIGPRQDPNGAYAAVVPKWLHALRSGQPPQIFGDGQTSRDFCPVDNVVQANLLAATGHEDASGLAFNVGLGSRSTLLELLDVLSKGMAERGAPCANIEPEFGPFRKGDVRHSLASIERAETLLGYAPTVSVADCLNSTMDWFVSHEG